MLHFHCNQRGASQARVYERPCVCAMLGEIIVYRIQKSDVTIVSKVFHNFEKKDASSRAESINFSASFLSISISIE